jgi:hypothetical protein
MEIYVQSSGYSPDFGYCWMRELPPYLSKVSSYIQNDSPSLVLARFDNNLFLLVTDLSSPKKKDFRDRPIRHSVAWVCEDNDENEKILRAIACRALKHRDDLTEEVDQLIKLDTEKGFTFDEDQFKNLSKSTTLKNLDKSPDSTIKIAKNSQALQNVLAEELQNSRLPSVKELSFDHELLVVVTGIKSEDTLRKAHIWRSLSSLVKSDNWDGIEKKGGKQTNFMVAIALILLLVTIAIILWILLIH